MNWNTLTASLLTILVFSVSCLMPALTAQELTEEGQLRKSAHDFLFSEFATNRKCDYTKDKSILKEIVVSTQRVEANGELVIELPEGAQRIASMFRHLVLRGKEASTNQKWAAEVKNLFEPVTVNIPATMIQKENYVKIGNQSGLTITSVHMEIDKQTQEP